jgi:Cu+-exporting ATPase
LLPISDFESLTGKGIVCRIESKEILAGNSKLMSEYGIPTGGMEKEAGRLANEGKTPMYITVEKKCVGIIAVADVVKPGSADAVKKLTDIGIEVVMITGDNMQTAKAIAKQAGITRVLSEVLPQDKASEVKKLQDANGENMRGEKPNLFSQATKRQRRFVAMVGDGINDAPALVQADIGIAIGSGADVAIESAGVVLMHSSLMDVPAAVNLSKATIRNIKQNLFWAFGYNVAGIPIAAGVLYIFGGILLSPIIAAAAMSFSSVSVVTNALRLKNFKV